MKTRHDYKDRLFRFIFGNEKHKHYTLDLYNALTGSNYDDPSELELTTIGDAIYLSMKDDVSFTMAGGSCRRGFCSSSEIRFSFRKKPMLM